jgi:oligopeptidase A
MTSTHPFLAHEFAIRWSQLTADHVVADMRAAIDQATSQLAAIADTPLSAVTYANTLAALEQATLTVAHPWGLVSHLDSVMDEPARREAYRTVLPEVTRFFSGIPLNDALWQRIKALAESPAAASLNPVRKRHLDESVADFREAGADLPPTDKERLQQIDERLSAATQQYSENTLDSLNAFELLVSDPADLAGLPANQLETARRSALDKGYGTADAPQYRLTLHAPCMIPVMKYVANADIRRALWEGFTNIAATGEHDNTALVREILNLRQQKAELLGQPHFPDWVLSRRMAKSGATALDFVEQLHARTKPAFDAENAELTAWYQQQTGDATAALMPWDQGYWAEKLRMSRYQFDEEALRPYFPLDQVLAGMFDLCQRIFSIRVTRRTSDAPETWHPQVSFYDIHDAASGQHLGSFYTDWFPRESKRSGAWMNHLITGDRSPDAPWTPHLGLMCGNMTPPVGDVPALLNHREVETVFHEFGHLIHHLLGEVEVKSLNGVNVAWDFVELPSQIMENWCWDRSSLDLFARHYQTGETIPQPLFEAMHRARNFHAARGQMRQLQFGRMDLALHLEPQRFADGDLDAALAAVVGDYLIPSPLPPRFSIRNFGHLFSDPVGYAAAYYSYKWAEVLDADAFTRFSAEGVLNPATGMDFRRCILARGNAAEPGSLFRDFMGRDPDPSALLKRIGLVA